MDAKSVKDAAEKVVYHKGRLRLKEIASIIAALGWLASCNLNMDVKVEKGKIKDISVLVGELAKNKQECDLK